MITGNEYLLKYILDRVTASVTPIALNDFNIQVTSISGTLTLGMMTIMLAAPLRAVIHYKTPDGDHYYLRLVHSKDDMHIFENCDYKCVINATDRTYDIVGIA